jgi:copper chaperone CopZ
MASATYQVTGMTCEHCVRAVSSELASLDRVATAGSPPAEHAGGEDDAHPPQRHRTAAGITSRSAHLLISAERSVVPAFGREG